MTPTTLSAPPTVQQHEATTVTSLAPASSTWRHRLWRGRVEDSPLVRPALIALLVATAVLYLWNLGASGWANSFYSAAVQAGSESWKAFFFGSSDAANSITVDKTPMSLWPMSLSVRIFGLSSWAMLVPQALMGVGSVGLLYATVRRTSGSAWAGLLAGLVLAVTPVAALMFRFNNPDALLTLLLIGAVYATIRAIESPQRAIRWLVLGGSLVGFAFLTKMLQAFLVLPPLALVYLVAAQPSVGTRIKHLLIAFAAMIVAAGWWIAIVELWPASSRPYIGGSQNNSILELTLGYNGFGRLNGNETGSVGGGGGGRGGGGWGQTGLFRLFNSEIGGQIAWLLPAALTLLVLGLWFRRGAGRRDRQLTGLIVWGGWLLVTGLTFSFMAGIFHAYYTVALAPAIAALVGIGASILWDQRASRTAVVGAAVVIAMTAVMSYTLLGRSTDFAPWLKYVVIVGGIGTAILLILHRLLPRQLTIAVVATAVLTMIAGPAAYAIDTASTPHTGSIPTAGPSTGGGMGGGMGRPGGGGPGGGRGTRQAPPQGQAPPTGQGGPGGQTGQGAPGAQTGQGAPGAQTGQPSQGNAGGLLSGSSSTDQINTLLASDASSYTWVGAAVGSNSASGYQLATGLPVMAIGGFNGSDPSPTLAQFKQYVAAGKIHYFIASGGGGGGGGMNASGSTSSEIATWVAASFTAQTVDGVTLYDLSGGVQ